MLATLQLLLALALLGVGLPSGAGTRTGGINPGPEACTRASAPASLDNAWEKGPNTSHYHLDGKGKHYSSAPGDKDPGFLP